MKKFIYFFTFLVFAFTSCEQDEIIDHSSDQGVELIGTTLKGKQDKVTICHYDTEMDIWKTIYVNGNALTAHLNHGDVQLIDADGDGWATFENECMDGGDCDDNDATVNPGTIEIPYNGKDDDCDPVTLDDDLDGDGFLNADDCDDTDTAINPGAEEICDNGIDDNCNGEIDEDCIPSPQIGDFYQGGVIYYVLQPGDYKYTVGEVHGLIASLIDTNNSLLNTAVQYDFTFPPSAIYTGTEIGLGLSNTLTLIEAFGLSSNYAAGSASLYKGGGYEDWFLPSKDELKKMYDERITIETTALINGGEGITPYPYWSSSQEYDITFGSNAWYQDFSNGDQYFESKNTFLNVRAVRAF